MVTRRSLISVLFKIVSEIVLLKDSATFSAQHRGNVSYTAESGKFVMYCKVRKGQHEYE